MFTGWVSALGDARTSNDDNAGPPRLPRVFLIGGVLLLLYDVMNDWFNGDC